MIQIFKKASSKNGSSNLLSIKKPAPGCWINVSSPTAEEIGEIEETYGIKAYLINELLDSDSLPRIEREMEKDLSFVLVKVPCHFEDNHVITVPFGIVFLPKKKYVFTICLNEVDFIGKIIGKPPKKFSTENYPVFFYFLMKKITVSYMRELNVIENEIINVEQSIKKTIKNKEVLLLLSIQKTLVYFRTALVGNKTVLSKLAPSKIFHLNSEGKDLLSESMLDVNEAQQLVSIYSEIITNMMSAYSSIISNNFNSILRFLALVTIAISIPTMIGSFYGMNVDLPFQKDPIIFYILILIAVLSTGLSLLYFKKRGLI